MEIDRRTLRDAFFDRLYQRARVDEDIVLVVADMSAPSLDKFRKNLSGQFVNVGIAEANAILISSGLALAGKKVYTYAISPFITLRCLEQIRVNNAIMEIPINIIGMGTGYSYITDGPTHHLIEDIAIMRAMPRICIYNPADTITAECLVDLTCGSRTTNYIRLDKDTYPHVYTSSEQFNSDGVNELVGGGDFAVVSTGVMIHSVKSVIEQLNLKSPNIGLIEICKFPIDSEKLLPLLKRKTKIISVEEHFLPGGLGSALAEIILDNNLGVKLKRVGVDPSQGFKSSYQYGGREIIKKNAGIDSSAIEEVINSFFYEG
jgi:transketolase